MEVLVEFDYTAQNADELDIKKGDRIRNVIRKEEGWYEGELSHTGMRGLFPDNFVKPVKIPAAPLISKGLPYPPAVNKSSKSPDDKKKLLIQNSIGPVAATNGKQLQKNIPATSPPPPPPPSILNHLHQQQQQKILNSPLPIPKPVKQPSSPLSSSTYYKARVLYSYIPINDDELAIQENEIVQVIRLVEDGWYEGIFGGKQGVFPSNYVEKIPNEPLINSSHAASNESINSFIENSDPNETDKKKNKKVLGIGLGNIFSGKTIELKTKENFANSIAKNRNGVIMDSQIDQYEKNISDSFLISDTNNKATLNGGGLRIKARVLYEYIPAQQDELKLTVGEYIYILEKNLDDEGWWRGESISTGAIGVFPDNFVEELHDMSPRILLTDKKTKQNGHLSPSSELGIDATGKPNQNSLTNSTTSTSSNSNTSSNNSLSKLSVINKTPVVNQTGTLLPAEPNANSKSQSDLSEDLEEFNNPSETNKLIHIKKTKQTNKRPPSFRKKKNTEKSEEADKDVSKTPAVTENTVDQPNAHANETYQQIKDEEPAPIPSTPSTGNAISLPTIVPTPPVYSVIAQPQLLIGNRQLTSLSMNGTGSEMSMVTAITNVDNYSHNSPHALIDEIGMLKEELEAMKKNSAQIKTEFKQVKVELGDLKSLHDEQMRKMQRKLFDMVTEIDEEKKTRLALQVELERIKKTIMNNI